METGVNPPSHSPLVLLQSLFCVHSAPRDFLFLLWAHPSPPALIRDSSTVAPVFSALSHIILLCGAKFLPHNHMLLEPVVDVKAIIRRVSCSGDVSSWLCVKSRPEPAA